MKMPSLRQLPSDYNTKLKLADELAFRAWLAQNKVPFDPNAGTTDYDMRGFWQGAQQQRPGMTAAVNPNDNQMHYPDTFKTPYHPSFSRESQWAGPDAPRWMESSALAGPVSRLVNARGETTFDETAGRDDLARIIMMAGAKAGE
jgi:hypothetical protein